MRIDDETSPASGGEATMEGFYGIRLRGDFALLAGPSQDDVTPRGRKARALLAYLACRPDHTASRERVAALLWSERSDAQARTSLRQTLQEIKTATNGHPPLINADRRMIHLDPMLARVDIDTLEIALGSGDADRIATLLDQGGEDFLIDLDDVDPAFDGWLRAERARRQDMLLAKAARAASAALQAGRPEDARRLLAPLLVTDPTRETLVRLALSADHATGDRVALLRRYHELKEHLHRELGAQPAEETTALFTALSSEAPKGADAAPTAVPAETPAVTPLPAPPVEIVSVPAKRPGLIFQITAAMVALIVALAFGIHYISSSQPMTGLDGAESPPAATKASSATLAVLPFTDLSDTDQRRFADGLSEEISNLLARRTQLAVIGQTSSQVFRGRTGDIREIGQRLGVTHLLEGSVRTDGPRVRVNVALVETAKGLRLWSEQYDGKMEDIFALQDKIGAAVATRLATTLSPAPAVAKAEATTPSVATGEAYQLYMTARGILREDTPESTNQAATLLARAVALKPDFTAAKAYHTYAVAGQTFWANLGDPAARKEGFSEAVKELRKTLAENPDSPEANAILGSALPPGKEKRRLLERAVVLDPNYAEAWVWLGLARWDDYEYDKELDAYRRAVALEPLWIRTLGIYVFRCYELGHVKEARAAVKRMLDISQDRYTANLLAANLAWSEGELAKSYHHVRKAYETNPSSKWDAASMIMSTLERLGATEAAKRYAAIDPKLTIYLIDIDDPVTIDAALAAGTTIYDNPYPLNVVGKYLLEQGRGDELLRNFDKVYPSIQRFMDEKQGYQWEVCVSVMIAMREAGRMDDFNKMMERYQREGQRAWDNGYKAPNVDYFQAEAAAIAGQKTRALDLFERSYRNGFRLQYGFLYRDPGREPAFASLKGEPRFERVRAQYIAALEKQRQALGALPPP